MSDADTKNSIIREASDVFAKYGYRKANLDDIAARLGKGKSFIYYYFKNKEEIFNAVLKKEAEHLTEALSDAVDEEDDAKAKLKSFVLVKAKTLREIVNFYQIIKEGYFSNRSFFENLRIDLEKKELEIVEKIFRTGIESGEFKKIDFKWAAESFLTAMKGFELPLVTRDSFEDIEKRADALLNLLFYGIIQNNN